MRYRFTYIFGLTVLAGIGCPVANAQAPPPADVERLEGPITDDEFRLRLDEESAKRVDGWIAQLGSPDYQRREQATRALTDFGAQAMSKLREAYHASDDLETRLRIEQIVRTAYVNYHVLDHHGFLGISMSARTPDLRGVPGLPQGTVGVSVANVIADTGAQRAGVQKNDVIIAVDGRALKGAGLEVRNSLSATIRSHRPGTTIELTAVRNARILKIEAILRRPSEATAREGRVMVVSDLYRQAAERFGTWWALYFRDAPSSATETGADQS